jgi:hypothetical protein
MQQDRTPQENQEVGRPSGQPAGHEPSPKGLGPSGDHQAQFTPGPWAIGNGGHTHGTEWEIRSADDADWYITGVPWGDDKYDTGIPRYAEAIANARLIAAAPELYGAAEAAEDILESYVEFLHKMPASELELHPYIPSVEDAFDMVTAALRKARGDAQ